MTRMVSDGYDRRIGGRVDMAAIPVRWRVPLAEPKRRGGWRRRPEAESGLLLDLSVSGLQVRAPAADDLVRGSVVGVALDGVEGWGTIRRVAPVPRTRFCDYGVELSPDAVALVQWVHDRVAATSGVDETGWR